MTIYQVFKPDWRRFIMFGLITIYFLVVNSSGFYMGGEEGIDKRSADITVIGYPYAYLKTSDTQGTHFYYRNFFKNLVIAYFAACLLIVFLSYSKAIFWGRDYKAKTLYISIAINSFIAVLVLLKVYGGDYLTEAALKEDKQSMELLLTFGVNPDSLNSEGKLSPLIVAAQKNNVPMAKMLLQNGANLEQRNLDGNTALHEAVKANAYAMVEYLIKKKASVNARNYKKSLPIHLVHNYKMAKLLVRNKSNLTFRNDDGYPPIFFAPDEKTLHLYRRNGASLDMSAEDGRTLMDVTNNPSIISYLVSQGAAVNRRNRKGDTPLHKLMRHKQRKSREVKRLIRTLVKKGASVDIRDSHGYSALHYAIKNCDISFGQLFLNKSNEAKRQLARKKLSGQLNRMAIRYSWCWDKIKLSYKAPSQKKIKKASQVSTVSDKSKGPKKGLRSNAAAHGKKPLTIHNTATLRGKKGGSTTTDAKADQTSVKPANKVSQQSTNNAAIKNQVNGKSEKSKQNKLPEVIDLNASQREAVSK